MVKKKIHPLDLTKIGENISKLMESANIDATELAEQTGLPNSTISRLRSETTESSPNISSLIPIADFFCITVSQLLGEEPINPGHGKFKPNKIKKIPLPVLNAETILEYLAADDEIEAPAISVDFPVSSKSYAYFLQGNAMEPQFPDKTVLIIDPALEVENLDHVLVIPKGKKTPIFRQVLIDGDEKYLRALNPSFNELIKLTPDSHTMLGVMIQSRCNFKNIEFQASSKNLKEINSKN